MKIEFTLNAEPQTIEASPWRRLLDVLRVDLKLTGTKEGCGEGECGSCAVLLDDEPVNACLVAIGQCEARAVVTVEGLANDGRLAPIQRCLSDHGGAQCGICSPGVLLSAEALLRNEPTPTPKQIRDALAGNLCRCTGYERIIQSVLEAARERRQVDECSWGAEGMGPKGCSL